MGISTHTRQNLAFLSTILLVLVAGCGSDSSESDTTEAAAETTTTAAETTTSQVPTTEASTTTSSSTTTTTAPTTTTTAPPAGASLDSPVRVGEVVQVGEWRIRVAEVTPQANDAVAAENQFNDPPAEGRQYFMARIEGTYTGSESSNFWLDMNLKAVGPSNVAYEGMDASCGVIPDAIDDTGETFPGGSVSGNVCWSVSSDDAAGLVMIVEETFTMEDTRSFLSLDPSAAPVEASTSDDVDGSSRLADAVPVSESAAVGPWTLTVLEVTPDATDAVLAENQFNEAPADGHQFYMARVSGTYDGNESSTFWVDMSLKAVGDSSVAYEGFGGSCGVIPDDLNDAGETFPGGSIEGNVCWSVRTEDVGSLVMIAEESFTMDEERVFFSLTDSG